MHVGPGRRRPCGGSSLAGCTGAVGGKAAARGGSSSGVPAGAGQDRLRTHARGMEWRFATGPGLLQVVPLPGRQPETDLRTDRDRRHLLCAPRRPGPLLDDGVPHRQHGPADHRRRRDHQPQPERVPRLLQEPGGHVAGPARGWLYTGDYGTLDPTGDIIMFDRMSDVITLADGSKMSPWIIEAMLKFTPYIQEAMAVYAPDGGTLAAILNIDMRSVGKWAEDREIAYTSFADLSQKPEVLDLLHGIVRDVNRRLRPEWRVRRFVSLYKEFHPDDDELTRTRKLRRRFIAERYRSLIAAMCAGQTTFDAALLVHYEDGTTREVHTTLQIKDVETLER